MLNIWKDKEVLKKQLFKNKLQKEIKITLHSLKKDVKLLKKLTMLTIKDQLNLKVSMTNTLECKIPNY